MRDVRIATMAGLVMLIAALVIACAPAAAPEGGAGTAATPAPKDTAAAKDGAATKGDAWDELVAAAQAEGRLVVQAVVNPVEREELPRAFREEFGIEVEYISLPSTQAAERAILEAQSGNLTLDVMLSGQSTLANQIYPEDILRPIDELFVLPELTDPDPAVWEQDGPWFMDPDKKILRVLDYVTPLIQVNYDEVPEGAITTADDLLDPQWRGKIAVNDPSVPGPGASHVAVMMRAKGEQYVIDLIDGQEAQLTRDRRQLADWLAEGRYPITIGVPSRDIEQLNADGFNLGMLNLEDVPTPRGPGSGMLVVFEDAPHPNAAKLFVNWLLTRDVMQQYIEWNQAVGTRTDLDVSHLDPILIPDPDGEYFDTAEWEYTTQERSREFARLRELFSR